MRAFVRSFAVVELEAVLWFYSMLALGFENLSGAVLGFEPPGRG